MKKKIFSLKTYLSSIITILISSIIVSFVSFSYAAYLNYEIHNHEITVNMDYSSYFATPTPEEAETLDANTYLIKKPEHLNNLSKLVAIGVFGPQHIFKLGESFSYGDNDPALIPIGSDDTPFYSTFDGQGNTITNLKVVGEDIADVGMFGYVANGATIKNYILINPVVIASGTYESSSYTNDGFVNRTKNLLKEKFDKNTIDNIAIEPDLTDGNGKVEGTVNGTTQVIGFKKFSITGLDSIEGYTPNFYCSKNFVTYDAESKVFTLNTSENESQYFTIEVYVEGLVLKDETYYYSRYTLERFKIYLKVVEDSNKNMNRYFVYNATDEKVYRKTIETTPSYMHSGNSTVFFYNRHVVYAGIVCGHLDGKAEYIGVINGTLKASNRPIRSNSILIGKRIDDDDISSIAKESINFSESIDTGSAITWTSEKSNGIDYSNQEINNNYVKNIYKTNNEKSTLSDDAEKFFRIYGSNVDTPDGVPDGVAFKTRYYKPIVNDGEGNYIVETNEKGEELQKTGTFLSINKEMKASLDGKNEIDGGVRNPSYIGSKNYKQENCISMWITKESSQASVLETLFSQTGDFYLNFSFDYLFFDSKATDEDSDGTVDDTTIKLKLYTTTKHNKPSTSLPYLKILWKYYYYYYYEWSQNNGAIDNTNTYYYPFTVTDQTSSKNGRIEIPADGSDPLSLKDGLHSYADFGSKKYLTVAHKEISIASKSSYFNLSDTAQRTPIFNLGLDVPNNYATDGKYYLELLNFNVSLTSTSGNVVGDPLTVDFLTNATDKITYDSAKNTYTSWANNSMVNVSTSCFSKLLNGTKGTDYNYSNGEFKYEETANYGSYSPLVPQGGQSSFYIVTSRASNSRNNKNNVTITYYNSVSNNGNDNIPVNETGYVQANIVKGP